MAKVLISETKDGKIRIGNPDELVKHGGSWTAALGRMFQGEKDGLVITMTQFDGFEEKFYLEEKEVN